MTIPYSSPQLPFLGQIKDVQLDNVQASDILRYDSTTGTWNNAAGGSISGTTDAVLFKGAAFEVIAPNNGITKNANASGYTINLDTTNKYVGINKANPTSNLDVSGVCLINTIEISGNNIGNIDPNSNIRLFSHNLPDTALVYRSDNDIANTGGFRTRTPVSSDTVYPASTECFYKVKLSLGMDKWSGTAPFDTQNDYFNLLGFPTSQVVEYQNRAPITGARMIGTALLEGGLATDTTRIISFAGSSARDPNADDLYYDPVQMRSRKIGADWMYVGAPSVWRSADKKLIFTIKFFVSGTYPARRNNNVFKVYANQYRSGALLRTNEIYSSPSSELEHTTHGERTFLSYSPVLSEDFNPATDDWIVELYNTANGDSFTTTKSYTEIICYEAQ